MGLAKKVAGSWALEQFPKIINTESDDQQAAEGIGHGMEVVFLNQ
jgi:hypothetical protein